MPVNDIRQLVDFINIAHENPQGENAIEVAIYVGADDLAYELINRNYTYLNSKDGMAQRLFMKAINNKCVRVLTRMLNMEWEDMSCSDLFDIMQGIIKSDMSEDVIVIAIGKMELPYNNVIDSDGNNLLMISLIKENLKVATALWEKYSWNTIVNNDGNTALLLCAKIVANYSTIVNYNKLNSLALKIFSAGDSKPMYMNKDVKTALTLFNQHHNFDGSIKDKLYELIEEHNNTLYPPTDEI